MSNPVETASNSRWPAFFDAALLTSAAYGATKTPAAAWLNGSVSSNGVAAFSLLNTASLWAFDAKDSVIKSLAAVTFSTAAASVGVIALARCTTIAISPYAAMQVGIFNLATKIFIISSSYLARTTYNYFYPSQETAKTDEPEEVQKTGKPEPKEKITVKDEHFQIDTDNGVLSVHEKLVEGGKLTIKFGGKEWKIDGEMPTELASVLEFFPKGAESAVRLENILASACNELQSIGGEPAQIGGISISITTDLSAVINITSITGTVLSILQNDSIEKPKVDKKEEESSLAAGVWDYAADTVDSVLDWFNS